MNNIEFVLFSVITPVYNRADCVTRCLESVLNQQFDDYEMIVINDGSTDHTLSQIQGLQSNFKHFKLISYPENKGVNYARNRGIELAKGEFIVFLDSDDMLTENALQIIQHNITDNAGYSHYLFGVSDRITDPTMPKRRQEFTYQDWLSGNITGDFAHVIKPSCFEGLMFLEEFRIYEALNWLRVLRKNKSQLYIPFIVLERERERSDSATKESILRNRKALQNNYNYLYQFITWYSNDFKYFNLTFKLNQIIQKALLIGIALNESVKNKEIYSKLSNVTASIKLINALNFKFMGPVILRLIQFKSAMNQVIKK